ncbi:MAG: hypothetical protein AAGC72_15315 [Planctomycetota bacterium]
MEQQTDTEATEEGTTEDQLGRQDHEPTKTLPSARSNTKSQFDLLRAWAVASGVAKKAASTPEVAKIAGRDSSTVSSCNSFFSEIGLLKKEGRSYVPAEEVFDYNRQHEWSPDKAPQKLAPILKESWAWEAVGGRLSFNPMSEKEVVAVLADACSAGPKYKNQLDTLLDYLIRCGLAVRQDSGKIAKGELAMAQKPKAQDPPPIEKPKPEVSSKDSVAEPAKNSMSLAMSIEVSMDEVSKLGPQHVGSFFGEWAKLVNAKAAIEKMMNGEQVDAQEPDDFNNW